MNIFIYYLKDPRYNEPRYVGYSYDINKRLMWHLNPSKLKERNYKNNWIKSLLKEGIKPEIYILEKVNNITCFEREKYWISFFKTKGYNLTNSNDGGLGGLNPSLETRKKLSLIHKGKQFTKEHKQKISIARTGIPRPESVKEKLRAWHTGRKNSIESNLKNAASQKGNRRARKITKQQAIEIKKAYDKRDMLMRDLAIKYNVNRQTIANVINNKFGYLS